MEFFDIALRLAMSGHNRYAPYRFTGVGWTNEEINSISAAISPHVPEAVDSMFNTWIFRKAIHGGYYAKRATWDMGMYYAESVEEITVKITEYYTLR